MDILQALAMQSMCRLYTSEVESAGAVHMVLLDNAVMQQL